MHVLFNFIVMQGYHGTAYKISDHVDVHVHIHAYVHVYKTASSLPVAGVSCTVLGNVSIKIHYSCVVG